MTLYILVNRIYEPGTPYPVVEHRFFGQTKEEAEGTYHAHLAADAFLRGCVESGLYAGKVACRSEMFWAAG